MTWWRSGTRRTGRIGGSRSSRRRGLVRGDMFPDRIRRAKDYRWRSTGWLRRSRKTGGSRTSKLGRWKAHRWQVWSCASGGIGGRSSTGEAHGEGDANSVSRSRNQTPPHGRGRNRREEYPVKSHIAGSAESSRAHESTGCSSTWERGVEGSYAPAESSTFDEA